jgi:hypothetical protein
LLRAETEVFDEDERRAGDVGEHAREGQVHAQYQAHRAGVGKNRQVGGEGTA